MLIAASSSPLEGPTGALQAHGLPPARNRPFSGPVGRDCRCRGGLPGMRPGRVPGSAPLACTGRAPWNLPAGCPEGPVFKGLRGGIHQLATATGNDYIRPNGSSCTKIVMRRIITLRVLGPAHHAAACTR